MSVKFSISKTFGLCVRYQTLYTYQSCPIALLVIKLIQLTYFIHWLVFNESPQLVYTLILPFIPNMVLLNGSKYMYHIE